MCGGLFVFSIIMCFQNNFPTNKFRRKDLKQLNSFLLYFKKKIHFFYKYVILKLKLVRIKSIFTKYKAQCLIIVYYISPLGS